MLIDHLSALPPGEEQDQLHGKRNPESSTVRASLAVFVRRIEIHKLEQDSEDVAAGVQPGVAQVADLNVA